MTGYLPPAEQRFAADLSALMRRVYTLEQQMAQVVSVPLGAWTAYAPTWTASTNPVLNNGTLTGRYSKLGRLVSVVIYLSIGSSTTLGSGQWNFSLPAVPNSASVNFVGSWWASVAGNVYTGPSLITASTLILPTAGGTTNYVDATHPAAWATSNQLSAQITYESTS